MKEKQKANLRVRVVVGKFDRAHQLLSKEFASSFRDTYLRGKTEFRDFVHDKMGCSLLEEEKLVDTLEKNGKIAHLRDWVKDCVTEHGKSISGPIFIVAGDLWA